MIPSTSKVESSSQDVIPECEWHTKDPITGEIFFLSKGVLYSQFPSKEKQKIISIDKNEIPKKNEKNKNLKKNIYLTNSAKFSNVYKGSKIQIFGGNSIANCFSQNEAAPQENYVIVNNIIHTGIVILEFICPISLTNLAFGMISEKNLESNIIPRNLKTFKTSSKRNLIMRINYWNKECAFYLNDSKVTSFYFNEDETIPIILIKKKSSCVILNPLVKYYLPPMKENFFKKEFFFKLQKKENLNLDLNGAKDNFNKYLDYFKKSFKSDFELKYAFGDVNENGEVCNFICAKFDKKFSLNLKNNFDKICTNKNISLVEHKIIKQIKKNIIISADLSYLNEIVYCSKLNNKYIKEDDKETKKKEEDSNDEFADIVSKYIIENFEKIEIYKNQSISSLKQELEKIKKNENLLDELNIYQDKNFKENENNNAYIDYIKNEDCLLMINKNKLKIIKREDNGIFDLTNFFDSKNVNMNLQHHLSKKKNDYIIFEKDELKFFLQNFDFSGYLSYYPSLSKIYLLSKFLESVKNSLYLGNNLKNKILLSQENIPFFYSTVLSFLNFCAFVTKRYKNIKKKNKSNEQSLSQSSEKDKKLKIESVKTTKSLEKEKMEKENLNLMNVFPFGCFENEIISEDLEYSVESVENSLNYDDYLEYISNNSLIYAKLYKIINKIISQISIRNPDLRIFGANNIFNSYENMSSFVNYPFILKNNLSITSLSDAGFYCENAFTNELKLCNYPKSRLTDTDMLTSKENIELYLKENIPSYIYNSPLRDYSPIINSSYVINNMNFIEEEEKIELYDINPKYPLIATCTKNGIVNIYSYSLGLHKLGSVNIFKGIKKPKNFSEIGDVFSDCEKTGSFNGIQNVKNIEEFLMNKKTLLDVNNKGIHVKFNLNNKKEQEIKVNEEALKQLVQMGFGKEACIKALKEKKNNLQEAIEYIFANPQNNEPKVEEKTTQAKKFIGKWSCPMCTYDNDGSEKCEMCEAKIPIDIYDKFLNNYTKEVNEKKKEEKKEEKKIEIDKNIIKEQEKIEKDLNLMEDDNIVFKDVLIKNIHIIYDPYSSDPFAPFILVVLLFDCVNNHLFVNSYKLMINPLCINSFIQFNTGKYTENVTNRRELDVKLVTSILNQKHFYNMHVLYPQYIGENLNLNKKYVHLIPVEHISYEIKIQSFFDSCIYSYDFYENNFKSKNINLLTLVEEPESNFKINQYEIQSPLYLFDSEFNKKSNMIFIPTQFDLNGKNNDLKQELKKISKTEFITELKLFQDEKNFYILDKQGYICISKQEHSILNEVSFSLNKQISLLKKVVPLYNDTFTELKKFIIYDEGQIIQIDLDNNKNILKEKEENIIENEIHSNENIDDDISDIESINVKKFKVDEIENLSNLLNTGKIEIELPKKGENINDNNEIKGITDVNENYYNKIYFDINKRKKIVKKLKFKNSNFIISTDIDIGFNQKNISSEKNQDINITDKSMTKINYNELNQKSITKEELFNLDNLIPLNIHDYKGSQAQYSINVSNILTGAHRFVSNYPKPEFIFSHLNNELMIIDNIIISSDISAKSVDIPFGEGLIFLMNSLDNIEKAKENFANYNYNEFDKFINEKKNNNEDLYEYEPVTYIKMDKNEIICSNVIKNKKCRYIYFLPTNGRDGNTQNFEKNMMSFLFFGVQGKVAINSLEKYYEDRSNYIFAKFGKNSFVDNIKLEIYGFNKAKGEKYLIGKKDKFQINDVILNKELDSEFYLSKNILNNSEKNPIDSIEIVIDNNYEENDIFEGLDISVSFTTFKISEKIEKENNEYNKLSSQFYKLITNQNLFEEFVYKFIPLLTEKGYEKNKKLEILRYFNSLFHKKSEIKSKILSKIDYYEFIKKNILNDDNHSLSEISINFIIEAYQNQMTKKIIEDTFDKILKDFKTIEFTNNGFNNFIKLLSFINIDKSKFKSEAISLIKQCLQNIEENNFQTKELSYLNTFLFLNNYPSDLILFSSNKSSDNALLKTDNKEESNNKDKKSNNNSSSKKNVIKILNAINYRGNMNYHKEYYATILCFKETYVIEELHLYFDSNLPANISQGFNFRIQLYSVENNKIYDLKASKYFYDHTWKLVTKTTGKTKSSIKNKDLKDKYYSNDDDYTIEESLKNELKYEPMYDFDNNVIKINLKKWNNEFIAHYIYFEISINDGTKEMNLIPNMIIFPIVIGKKSVEQYPPQEQFDKFYNSFNITKKKTFDKIKEMNYYESNFEKKRVMLEYDDQITDSKKSKLNEDNKINKDSELLSFYSELNSKNEQIVKKIKLIVEGKKSNEEKDNLMKEIYYIQSEIDTLHTKINEYNPKTTLNKNYSFNIQLIKILISELNSKKDIEFDINEIYTITLKLIDIIIFNLISLDLYDNIYSFVEKYFFKAANSELIQKLFSYLVTNYISKENKYRNVRTIIGNKIWMLFDIKLFIEELKKCFDKENIKEWTNKNFNKLFYKISVLISIITKKLIIKEQRELISLKEMSEYATIFIKFINENGKELKNEYSDLILNKVLSLYSEHLLLTDKYERIKDIEPDKKIDFLIELLFINDNKKVKDKIENIIQLLLYPYKDEKKTEGDKVLIGIMLENDKDKDIEKEICYGDKIIIMFQKKILEYINKIIENKKIEKDDNKLKYALSLLNTGYTLKKSDNKENENIIKNQNNKIIEGFIKILSFIKTKENNKIGFSEVNNFWRYVSSLLEKGTLEMMFDNNNFTILVIDCYLKLDKESQILLYTKLTNLFLILYKKEGKINSGVLYQIFGVIIHIMKNELYKENGNEYHLLDFLNNLLEIILYGDYNKKEQLDNKLLIDFNEDIDINLIKNLFYEISSFLLLKLNYSSFSLSECGNKLIYKRSIFMKYLLTIFEMYSKIFFARISEEIMKEPGFRKALKNYLIFFMFNTPKEKINNPPVLNNIVQVRNSVSKIIMDCVERKSLIKINLENIIEIVKKVDDITYENIKEGKISNKKGLKIITKLFNNYFILLNVFLVNDEITKYFAFELGGFKFSIDKINIQTIKHKKTTKKIPKERNLIEGINEMESESEEENLIDTDENELNEELLKMAEDENIQVSINKVKPILSKEESTFIDKFIKLKNIQNQKEEKTVIFKTKYQSKYLNTNLNPFDSPYIQNNYLLEENKLSKFIKSDDTDSQIFNGDLSQYKSEEFATTKRLCLLENGFPIYPNTYNWSIKKKPTNGYTLTQEMKDMHYYEQNIDYQLNYPIDLKEVFISFSQNLKLTEVIPEIYLECGTDYKKMDICVKLERLKDEQYNERSIVTYGFNFYSHKPELLNNDENYIENYMNQIITCHAQYFRFIIRRPIILSNKNSHIADINLNKLLIGINCISLTGVKYADTNKVIEYISEISKNISINIISMIFSGEFTETLRHISKDKSIFENIKQIYDSFEPNINKYVNIISKILINASKYNFELGDWLMQKLLNAEHDQIYAKLAVEIMKNNPEYVDKRINKYCSFLFKEIKNCCKKNKFENIGYFIQYFCLTLNGLLLSPFINKIKVNIDLDEVRNIMFNLHKYKPIKKELINIITIILLPHEKIILNENEIDASKFYHPSNSLKTLTDLYNNSYSYDYTELLSFLVSNNIRFEEVFVESETAKYFCELILEEINSGIRGRNMLLMTEMLKNMSYNSDFVKFIRKYDYDFKLFESIKSTDEKSDCILINNNINFLKNIVIFIRNCISGNEQCYEKLAKILIKDLDICQLKIDKEYANNVLIPLLSLEKVTYVCLHPINAKIKSNYCSYINLEANDESEKKEEEKTENKDNAKEKNININNKLSISSLSFNYKKENQIENKQNIINKNNKINPFKKDIYEEKSQKSIIPESELSEEMQQEFTKLFNTFEYQKGKTFPMMNFKKVMSSKGITYDKLKSQIINNVINQGPFLIILYPSKLEKHYKTITFFYYNGVFPAINFSQNIDESEDLVLPYNSQHMIGQFSDKDYITACFKSEYNNSKDPEFCSITVEEESIIVNIMEIISLYLTEPKTSNVGPVLDNISIVQKKGMDDFYCINSISEYEIYVGKNMEKGEGKQNILFSEISNNKIMPLKYIDEIGSLNINYIKENKYYNPSHPFSLTRDNPIFEVPSNIKLKLLKDMFYSDLIPFKNLNSNEVVDDDINLDEIEKYKNSNIVDLYYDIQSLKDLRNNILKEKSNLDIDNKISKNINQYEPILPVLLQFEKLGGISKIISVIKATIKTFKTEKVREFWEKWIDNVDKYSHLPTFFSSLIRHKKCFDILFNLLCKMYDDNNSIKDVGMDAFKYILEILDNSFIETKTNDLRRIAIENGIFGTILEKLESLTHEKPRKFEPTKEEEKEKEKDKDKTKKEENNTNKKTKGVGYGSDKTGDNKSWDVNSYLEGKRTNSSQIVCIIKLLVNFFDCPNFEMNENLMKAFLESSILPCLESAFRGGTLLELSKDAELYMAYLELTVILSKNHSLIPLLLEISKDYKPIQTQSVYELLSMLNDGAKLFMNCLKQNSKKEKSNEEKLAIEIMNSYNIVSKNIKQYQSGIGHSKNYTEILKLPLEKSYPLLLRELTFDYMSMKGINGKYVHYYSESSSSEPTPAKAIRLAQEFADLPRALPCESTNSIYVRIDKDNMDYMKVLIIGSEGTPYSNGAFQFDVFFDNLYPNGPPKVTLMTTGSGTTRFNPNLYANGKVCLSLLGTWRGHSTENWDPKISTLLQVLISIQSIIMSDLVYYNEPSCESEMGTSQGEAKNEAYSNIVRYANIKFAMIEQIKKPSKGFEEVIKRHFYLKKDQILKEVREWIKRSKTAVAKYSSFSYDHNPNWANKFNKTGEYTRMLQEIYYELETTLNGLPLPQELKQKADDEKIEKEKKKEKMKFENIENVDVSYNDDDKKINKEINLNDDKVKDRWSRYIGAMGMEAVRRQANSTILIYGAGGLGIEIAKNLVLSGCKELVLQDNKLTTYYDLSSQFYLNENDIGKNRAECCIKKLQNLNYYVKVTSSKDNLPDNEKDMSKLKKYNVIVLTECDYDIAIKINKFCRENKIYLIVCDIYGAAGRIINDFGDEFIVNDKDGEEAKEIMINSVKIKDEKTAEVSVLEGLRHDFSDGDLVELIEVVGLDGINKRQFKVKSLTKDKFEIIGDFKNIKNDYQRNGIVKEIKTQRVIKFKPIKDVINSFKEDDHFKLIEQNMSMSDFTKLSNGFIINIAFESINEYLRQNKYFVTGKIATNPWDYNQYNQIMTIASKILSSNKIELNDSQKIILSKIIFTHMTQFSPLCAYFGGFAAQEVIKAITNKYSPVNQVIYQDCLELIPDINIKSKETIEESLKEINYKDKNNRLDGLQVILGEKLMNKLINLKCLIVGAGAIGCELIKNFAMLNVGTGQNGAIYITDPDVIEVSNLTRQFLFREKHLRLPKSSTAAAAAKQMNPSLSGHIFAKLDKVCEETENIFSDEFFTSLDFVANALDNVNARRYVDSRCVSNRKPLLESGTLGPKGHVQVVIPFKTESYSSQNDPEVSNDIPQCTLKMFPEEAIHCVEWARDQFGKKFTQMPKALNKRIEEAKKGEENNDLKLTKKAIKWLRNLPKTFDDCLKIARDKYNKVFVINIKQLLYSYPLDKKDKNGKLFWTLPKRPPLSLDYSIDDQLCTDFISAYACLMANMFNIKIPYDNPRDIKSKKDMILRTKNMKVEEFKPNELKAKEIENEVESSEKEKEKEKNEIIDEDSKKTEKKENEEILCNQELINLLKEDKLGFNKMKPLTSVEFEKDDDTNFQIDLIYAMSALRCRNYKLEIMDWITVKIKAGRIIPALATTTSSIAALQTVELVKIAKNSPIEEYRNSFLNLAIPSLSSSEPGACPKNVIREGLTTTLWDKWEIYLDKDNCTIKSLFDVLKTKYLIFPRDIFKGKKPVYSYAAYKDKKELNEELINKKMDTLLGINFDKEEYVDLMVTFTHDEKSEEYIKNVPKVRLFFKK